MPVLNEELHLESSVRRVLDQDYEGELEVILAVGPSRDRTPEIADALVASDSRLRRVDNPAGRTPLARPRCGSRRSVPCTAATASATSADIASVTARS